MNLIQNFRLWLGENRFWALMGMFIITGLASLVLQFTNPENAIVSQNALLGAFLLGAILIIGSRMDVEQRGRWSAILIPSFGLVILGVIFFPQYLFVFLGGAFGWAIIGLMLFGNSRTPMQYRQAIKAMREADYAEAVSAMDSLIKEDPDDPNHYRFRAELLRLWGKLGRAKRDYQAMLDKATNDADKAVAYNGLAEVDLQAGHYDMALESAQKAYDFAPDEWVAAYNLGMIADRMEDNTLALDSLEKALSADISDSRHRLLVYLWQARAYARQEQSAQAEDAVNRLKQEKNGLKEWQKILPEEQAKVLRDVLSEDIHLAEKLINDEISASKMLT